MEQELWNIRSQMYAQSSELGRLLESLRTILGDVPLVERLEEIKQGIENATADVDILRMKQDDLTKN